MRFLGLFLAVGIVSIFQMYVAVPIGLSGNLNRGSIIIAAWIGGMIGVVAFVYWGGRIVALIGRLLNWVLRRRPPRSLTTTRPRRNPVAFSDTQHALANHSWALSARSRSVGGEPPFSGRQWACRNRS